MPPAFCLSWSILIQHSNTIPFERTGRLHWLPVSVYFFMNFINALLYAIAWLTGLSNGISHYHLCVVVVAVAVVVVVVVIIVTEECSMMPSCVLLFAICMFRRLHSFSVVYYSRIYLRAVDFSYECELCVVRMFSCTKCSRNEKMLLQRQCLLCIFSKCFRCATT